MSFYTYKHYAGYGRDDHLAGELIARAAAYLGAGAPANAYLAAAAGLASHSVPLGEPEVRIPLGPGVRSAMKRALRRAYRYYRERGWTCDCVVAVELYRVVHGKTIRERRVGRRWVRD